MLRASILGLVIAGFSVSLVAQAQVDEGQVNQLLGIMQRHVREKKLREIPRARLGENAVAALKLSRRAYRAGETWTVRFTPAEGGPGESSNVAATVRKASEDDGHGAGPVVTEPTLYDFRVLALNPNGEARISVTQRLGADQTRADSRVDHLVLVVSSSFVPVKKEIYYRDGRQPLSLVLGAQGATALGFDAAPTDLPNLAVDEGVPAAGGTALEFHSTDVYARPVTAVWHEGEVWPTVVTTASGTATLIK